MPGHAAALKLARFDFLRVVAAAGAGLTLGVEIAPPQAAAAADFSPVVWVRLSPDGTTTAVLNTVEMGQGITTGLSMLLADELDAPWESVRFEVTGADPKYVNPVLKAFLTAGSLSTPTMTPSIRKAGATARAMLVQAAAQQWNVDPAACTTSEGVVSGPGARRARYTELLTLAAALPVPADVKLKTPDQFKIIGTKRKRLDLVPKTNGRAVYGMDVVVPGMRYASVEKPLQLGAKLASFDASDALKVPGVVKVLPVSSGVAVVATNTWAAFQGRKALKIAWTPGANAGVSTETIAAGGRALVKTPGLVLRDTGDVKAALAAPGTKTLEALYETPYLSHAPMEPMNATADVRADGATVWAPTQSQTTALVTTAQITGLPREKIAIRPTFLGGGFGRRSEFDFVADAVEVSKAIGAPVKCVWTREDDQRNDTYRSGTVTAIRGALGADGSIAALHNVTANTSVVQRRFPQQLVDGKDMFALAGAGDFAYRIPNVRVENHMRTDVAIRAGYWRAPYANANTFVTESFIDELAHGAGKDPLAFRLAMLAPGSRQFAVLQRAGELGNWKTPPAAGRARGVAMGRVAESWAATVAELSLRDGKPVVHRMVTVADVGLPVNPDGLQQQMESSMVYAISAALWGKITFLDGVAQQANFDKYPVLKMADAPQFVTEIVQSREAPSGAGEVGLPAVAPAMTNALFALTGKRLRTLPIVDALT